MIKVKINFHNDYDRITSTDIKTYNDIDHFMDQIGYGFDKSEKNYEKVKQMYLNGEIVRFDHIGLKEDPQFYDELDSIMSIEIL